MRLYLLSLAHCYACNVGVDSKVITMTDNNSSFIPFDYEYTGDFTLEGVPLGLYHCCWFVLGSIRCVVARQRCQ